MTYTSIKTAIAVMMCLISVMLPVRDISAQVATSQDFETWPITASWGTTMHQGWMLSDGQVKSSRGGFWGPIDVRCGWLYDIDQSTNSWIVTPHLVNGAGNASFWVRRNVGSSATNTWAVQHSADATNWTTAQVFADTQDDWHEMSVDLEILEPVYVRITKTGDNGGNQYLGIDDILIETPPGLRFTGLTPDPAIPTSNDSVTVQVQLETGVNVSNVSIQVHYRPETSSTFSSISMVHTGGFGYETVSPIPAGFSGRIQYYIEGTYEGPGSSPAFAPDGGSNAPALIGVLDTNKLGIIAGDVWRYFDGPAEPGPDWNKLTFDDSTWSNGPALLGYGDPDIVTTISFGPDPTNKYITSYYRHTLTLTNVSSLTSTRLRLLRDDGALVYINGSEVYRNNMPAGPVDFCTPSVISGSPEEFIFFEEPFDSALLSNGINLVAVELHQQHGDTSDARFDFELLATDNTQPIIQNEPATNFTPFSAVIRATLVSTGMASTQVSAYWGPLNGETDLESWSNSVMLGVTNAGPISVALAGLFPAELYYYRFYATNAFGDVWAPDSTAFATRPRVISQVAGGSVWKYLDTGVDLGAAWRAPAFDDSNWTNGTAQLGYGDGDESTVVSFGADPTNKFITTYFRKRFEVAPTSMLEKIAVELLRDDGAVVYLNGDEVFRDNMPTGEVSHMTFAASSTLDETSFFSKTLVNVLVPGTNVLAVEVHQHEPDSSDLSFDLKLNTTDCDFPELLRGPYLQQGTPTNIAVRWRTAVPGNGCVRYGDAPGNLDMQVTNSTLTSDHVIIVTNLLPMTRYYYSVETSGVELAGGDDKHWFVTQPLPGSQVDTRIWAVGDSGTADMNAASVRNGYTVFRGTNHTDVWLMLGDNAYEDGTDNEHQEAVFDMYPSFLRNTTLWPTVGNHDAIAANSAAQTGPYFDIFTLPTDGEAGGIPSGTEAYYSFDHANIHFVCLNSMEIERSTNGTMMTWLRNDLSSTTQDWIIAYWHHPPYSKGSHDSDVDIELVEMRENALPILEEAGVDLVLCGHSHSYERSYYLRGHYDESSTLTNSMIIDGGNGRPNGDGAYARNSETGTVYVVSGSAGQLDSGSMDHPAIFVWFVKLGSLAIDADPSSLDVSFIDDAGLVLDNFSIEYTPPPLTTTSTTSTSSTSTTTTTTTSTSTTLSPPLIVDVDPDVTIWAIYTPTGTIMPMYSTNVLTVPVEWIPVSFFSNSLIAGTNVITFEPPDTNVSPIYFRLLRTL